MIENSVFMDTNVFTDIVENIRGTASECVLSSRALNNTLAWEGTNVGREIIETLKEIHRTSELYRLEASESLPRGFMTLRDSMIAIDDAASKNLTVEKMPGGVKLEQKR